MRRHGIRRRQRVGRARASGLQGERTVRCRPIQMRGYLCIPASHCLFRLSASIHVLYHRRFGALCDVSFTTTACRPGPQHGLLWGSRQASHAACMRLCRSQQQDRVPCDTTATGAPCAADASCAMIMHAVTLHRLRLRPRYDVLKYHLHFHHFKHFAHRVAAASADGQLQCLPEEDGSVLVRDDLDALLEVSAASLTSVGCSRVLLLMPFTCSCPVLWQDSLPHDPVQVLPPDIRGPLVNHPQRSSLLEVSCAPSSVLRQPHTDCATCCTGARRH